jgi:hypothetical protein
MGTIQDAKRRLSTQYRHEAGFVGVGLCQHHHHEALRVYVVDMRFPIAQRLARTGQFDGFPVEVEVTGDVRALAPQQR